MGSLWLVGSFKFKVSFAQEPYKRDSILQQKPMILRSLIIVNIPYVLCNVSKDASIHSCNFRQVSRWMRPMTTHGGDKTSNIWISRSIGLPDISFEWRGLHILNWKSLGMLGTPVKTCLICMGTPVKTCWIFLQSYLFLIRSCPSVAYVVSKMYLLGYKCICWSHV